MNSLYGSAVNARLIMRGVDDVGDLQWRECGRPFLTDRRHQLRRLPGEENRTQADRFLRHGEANEARAAYQRQDSQW
jgi:hypothetical protein